MSKQISDGMNPFLLLARIQVKPDKVEDYLNIADEVDKMTEKEESGMFLHNFDADPDNPLGFTWSEIYQNSDALLVHFSAPYALEYVGKHQQLADSFDLEIYGNLSDEAIAAVRQLGLPFKHYKTTRVGFARTEKFE